MFDGTSSLLHFPRRDVQAVLHGIEYAFMLPAPYPPFLAGGALRLEFAGRAGCRVIGLYPHPVLHRGMAIRKLPSGGAAILICRLDIDEIALVVSPLGLVIRGHGLRYPGRDACLNTLQDFRPFEIPPVSQDVELPSPHGVS